MKFFPGKNIGTADRVVRFLLGIMLMVLGGMTGQILIVLPGIFSIYEGLSSWCAFYALIGRNTCPVKKGNNGFHTIFITGWTILIAAVMMNFIASAVGLITWYGFLEGVSQNGILNTIRNTDHVSLLFLFVIYPYCLGLAGSFLTKITPNT